MARPRSLRVLFVRPGDRQALHPGLTFDVPRTGGDVLPVELLRLASAVKFGSRHQALVHDERHPSVAGAGPGSLLRGISRSLSPDVAVIWMHPACLADSLEAARQARHAGCSGPGPGVIPYRAGPYIARAVRPMTRASPTRSIPADGTASHSSDAFAACVLPMLGPLRPANTHSRP